MITLKQIASMPIGEVAKLPPKQLLKLIEEASMQLAKARTIKDWLQGALSLRYEEKARAKRLRIGKDTGTIRLDDEGISITCELPKKVEWDQNELFGIALKLISEGKEVSEYLDCEYFIPEVKYQSWPPEIKALFESARTIRTGKPSYKLSDTDKRGNI
ncbi:hypothetical protein I862_07385 [endosymbiont of Acanthamoeba sp. UWC8]|uniref:hypothetical protein n=1 Tax=endosymbiont of Acanthamoeba sp. UWC8 TaxID=86106 RepID=UPI0004D13DA0|nr:hypothetical protein [endosymbiont of Acanthamoeba sp. UWC8]AIF82031.1 hypothetical protein I862_07385 [endosymbiont of Acanthamoeba sp. UWC8]